ncbi:MAG TPA: acyltransferase family protein [Candidatus Anaerostipes avicola]|nr:acyltransferase family protein [uncultured Anaerostipes sp.]HJC83173.1 acyltransferase family protein [Candidatus Anaerostipes avicola]
MSHSEKNSRLFYPDFIRVIAFLCILLFHFQVETSHFAVFRGIPAISSGICEIDLGQLGVSLFFILSGASLMISKKPFDAVSFYKKRFFTLFPAYYLVWGGAFLGTLLLSPESLDGTPPWTILLTILGLDGYVYSICPNFYKVGEWFFGCLLLIYLFYPLLRTAMEKHPKIFLPIVLLIWILLMRFVPTALRPDHTFYLRIPEFLIGMYFMKYWNRKIYFQGLIGVLIFFCFLFLSPLPENFQVLCLAGTGTGAFMILRALACRISRFPLPRIKTAGISYEIFLLHHFVLIHLLRIFFANRILTQGMGILLFAGWCLLIGITAWILHRFLSSLSKSFLTN